jgi:hypothetical protein
MLEEFTCEASVMWRGKKLAMNKIVSRISLDDIMPTNTPFLHPADAIDFMRRDERRKRFVDMIAAEFAHALTEAIYRTHNNA